MNALKYLLSAYFHQDWDHTHQTWEAVIDDFLGDDPKIVVRVPDEINRLLAEISGPAELEAALINLGLAYDPSEGDRVWLLAVRDRILAGSGPSDSRQ